ncbi:MAG: glycoside hydrolase family 113, partial [Planctomycetota bacterium]
MFARTARSAMLASLLAAATSLVVQPSRLHGAGGTPAPQLAASRPTSPAPPPTTAAARPVPVRPLLGFAINAHHISNLDLYLTSVDRIAETGANALILITPMFQEHRNSTTIRYLPDRCPTDAQLLAILDRARSRGLQTTLLPIVLIEAPRHKEWRGVIAPTDWDAWWASYQRFISRFVALAESAGVDMLAVGSELNSTEDQIDRWQRVIARTR